MKDINDLQNCDCKLDFMDAVSADVMINARQEAQYCVDKLPVVGRDDIANQLLNAHVHQTGERALPYQLFVTGKSLSGIGSGTSTFLKYLHDHANEHYIPSTSLDCDSIDSLMSARCISERAMKDGGFLIVDNYDPRYEDILEPIISLSRESLVNENLPIARPTIVIGSSGHMYFKNSYLRFIFRTREFALPPLEVLDVVQVLDRLDAIAANYAGGSVYDFAKELTLISGGNPTFLQAALEPLEVMLEIVEQSAKQGNVIDYHSMRRIMMFSVYDRITSIGSQVLSRGANQVLSRLLNQRGGKSINFSDFAEGSQVGKKNGWEIDALEIRDELARNGFVKFHPSVGYQLSSEINQVLKHSNSCV